MVINYTWRQSRYWENIITCKNVLEFPFRKWKSVPLLLEEICISIGKNLTPPIIKIKSTKFFKEFQIVVVIIENPKSTFELPKIKNFTNLSNFNWYSAMQIIIFCKMAGRHAVISVLTSLIEFGSISIHNPNLYLKFVYI